MVTLIYPITTKEGFENLKRSLINLEFDLELGIDILCLVKEGEEELYLECSDFLRQNYDQGESLVVYERGDLYKKSQLYISSKNDLVFLANEKIVIPPKAITTLHGGYLELPGAGFISGQFVDYPIVYWVEDIYEKKNPKYIYSNEREGEGRYLEVDASGIYGLITRFENFRDLFYMEDLDKYGHLSYGIRLRRRGYQNYIDTTIRLTGGQ